MIERLILAAVAIWEGFWAYGGWLIYKNVKSEYAFPDMSMFGLPTFGEVVHRLSPDLLMLALPLVLIPAGVWIVRGRVW